MTDGKIEDLIGQSVEESHAAHCMVLALIEMLADRGVLEGSVEDLLGELGRRTQDIRLRSSLRCGIESRRASSGRGSSRC